MLTLHLSVAGAALDGSLMRQGAPVSPGDHSVRDDPVQVSHYLMRTSTPETPHAQGSPPAFRGPVADTLNIGATISVPGVGDIPVQGRETDVRNLQGLGLAALARVSAAAEAIFQASWAIKAMDPLPEDVTDDALWPGA